MQQQQHHDGHMEKIKYLTHLLAASFVGGAAAVSTTYHRKKAEKAALTVPNDIFPRLNRTGSGRIGDLERFSLYVARQLGLSDASECPKMCKLVYEYLKNSKGCKDSVFEYFTSEADAESLYIEFIEELDRSILSYFAFHWSQSSVLISQVFEVESEKRTKLKDYVLAATRKQRFERISKDLKVTRVFSTLVEEMKVIGNKSKVGVSKCTEVMKPVAHSERSPVLLLMGGGMGAGKSTVLKEILNEPFWAGAEKNAVVVEADAFKETDVLYRALSLNGHHHDMLQSAELVHQSSTDAASSLLVTALNDGRDVIMDGTLSWAPFLEQTIAMARNVHNCRYRMGVGYKVADDGTISETYWEPVNEEEEDDEHQKLNNETSPKKKLPYRIELVGVVCDAYLAVIRGIRRAIMIRRAVRVKSQLQSHQRFASSFNGYCQLVDNARLYCTNGSGPPKLIGWKNGDNNLLVDPEEIKLLTDLINLNPKADSIYELYPQNPSIILEPGSCWKEAVLSPDRPNIQLKLKACIQRVELINTSSVDTLG